MTASVAVPIDRVAGAQLQVLGDVVQLPAVEGYGSDFERAIGLPSNSRTTIRSVALSCDPIRAKMRLALTSLALLVGGAEAVFMPAIFKDRMVLQTPADGGRPASIFGYANPSEMVAVNMTINTANGPSLTQYLATADSSTGKWSVVVAPTGDDLTPSNVTFAIQGASDVQPSFIYNATFGEVILCNGQSNMVLSGKLIDVAVLHRDCSVHC